MFRLSVHPSVPFLWTQYLRKNWLKFGGLGLGLDETDSPPISYHQFQLFITEKEKDKNIAQRKYCKIETEFLWLGELSHSIYVTLVLIVKSPCWTLEEALSHSDIVYSATPGSRLNFLEFVWLLTLVVLGPVFVLVCRWLSVTVSRSAQVMSQVDIQGNRQPLFCHLLCCFCGSCLGTRLWWGRVSENKPHFSSKLSLFQCSLVFSSVHLTWCIVIVFVYPSK